MYLWHTGINLRSARLWQYTLQSIKLTCPRSQTVNLLQQRAINSPSTKTLCWTLRIDNIPVHRTAIVSNPMRTKTSGSRSTLKLSSSRERVAYYRRHPRAGWFQSMRLTPTSIVQWRKRRHRRSDVPCRWCLQGKTMTQNLRCCRPMQIDETRTT